MEEFLMTIEDAVAKLKGYCKAADGKMPKDFWGSIMA